MYYPNVCRICLSVNMQLFNIANTPLQAMYEKLICNSLKGYGEVCSQCAARLRSSCRLQQAAVQADRILTELVKRNVVITEAILEAVKPDLMLNSLSVTVLENINIAKKDNNITEAGEGHIKVEGLRDEDIEDIPNDHSDDDNIESLTTADFKQESDSEDDTPLTNLSDMKDDAKNLQVKSKRSYNKGAVLKKPTSTVQKMKKFIAPPSATRDNNQTVLKLDTSCSAISKVDKLNIGADVSEKIKCNLPEQNKLNESTPKDMTTSVKDGDLNSVIKMSIETSQAIKDENGSNIEKSFEDNISSDDITVQIDKMLETKMSCNQCSYKTSNKKHFICHLKAHIGKSFQCHLCSYRSLFKGTLKFHHFIVHSGEKKYKCDICNKKFSQKSDLKRHMIVHSGEKNYKCDLCSKKFSEKCNLKKHLTVHSGEKNYKCDICNKKFSRKYTLKQHLTVHSGEKNYKCDICSKKFSQKSNLQLHLTVHSGEKNYECDTCNKKFTHKHHLKLHLTVHSGEKNYKCDTCNKKFSYKSNLKTHMSVHSGEKNINVI